MSESGTLSPDTTPSVPDGRERTETTVGQPDSPAQSNPSSEAPSGLVHDQADAIVDGANLETVTPHTPPKFDRVDTTTHTNFVRSEEESVSSNEANNPEALNAWRAMDTPDLMGGPDPLDSARNKLTGINKNRLKVESDDKGEKRRIDNLNTKYRKEALQYLNEQPKEVLRKLAPENKQAREVFMRKLGEELAQSPQAAENPLSTINQQVQEYRQIMQEAAEKGLMKASRVTTNTAERRRILTDAFIKSHLEQAQQLAESDPFLKSRLDKYQAKKESSGMDSSPKPTQNVEMSEEQRRQQDLDRATANILESMKDRPFQKLTLVPDGSESKNNKTGLGPRTFTEPVELTRQREELEKNNSSTGESNPNIRNEVRAEEFADARARLEAETLDRLTTEKEYEQVHDGPLAGEVQVAGPRRIPTPEDIARAKEEVESNYTPEQLERGALEIEAIKREQDRKIAEADAPLIAEAQGSYTPQQLEQGAAEIDRIRQGQSNGTITFDGSSDSAATNEHASQTVPIVDDGPEGLTEEQRALWKAMHTTEQPEMRSDAVIQTSADATSPVTPHRMDGSSEFAVPMSDPDAKTVPENSPVTSSDDKLTEEQRALRDAMQGTNLSTGARMSESVISAKRLSGDRDFAAGRTEEPTEKTDKVASTMKLDEMVEPEPQVAVVGTDAFWDKLTEVAQANAPAINAETAATAKLFVNNLKDKEKVTPTNTVRGRVLNSARRLGGAAALTALLAAGSAGITSQPFASVPVTPQPTEMSMGSTTVNEMTSVVDQHSQTGGPEKEVSVDEAVTKAKQETGGGLVGLIRKTLFGVKNG